MRNSALGIASLILGFIGLFMSWTAWCFVPCLVAIVLGIIALTDYLSYKWSSICGISFAIMGCALIIYQLALPYRTVSTIAEIEQNTVVENVSTSVNTIKVEPQNVEVKPTPKPTKDYCELGDAWETDQWKLTVTDVVEVSQRNTFQEPVEAVYKITYTLENKNYNDTDGLFINVVDSIVDCDGEMGIEYEIDKDLYLESLPLGARKTAEAGVGVKHRGDFSLYVSHYDTNGNKQATKFIIRIN